MRRKVHYVIQPPHLWNSIANMARTQNGELLNTLQAGFKYIETESFESTFQGLFSEINLGSDKLGKTYADRNAKLCTIIQKIAEGLNEFSTNIDALGDAYEYLIGQFAAGSGKKAGEFYTPQQISNILSGIVTLDSQEPKSGPKKRLESLLDFACGSGSLLLNVRKRMGPQGIGKIYGQEKNITTYNLARMNMLLHGVKDTEFEIFHGDTLTNEWDMLRELNPAKKPSFDAIVANPPFSYRWEPTDALGDDVRFKNHGLAPKSAADFAFLLHGFHFLKDEGVMAIILPHGVLFRGGSEERIRTKLLKDGHIDTVIGLPANLFYSTGIPVCILVLKKCKKPDDVLFINAAEHFVKGKRQNQLTEEHIAKIIATYQYRQSPPAGITAPRTLGWLGRGNGPVDNPVSSCLSCHSTAQIPASSGMFPGASLSDTAKLRWFRNLASGESFDAGTKTLDFSLQLGVGIQNFSQFGAVVPAFGTIFPIDSDPRGATLLTARFLRFRSTKAMTEYRFSRDPAQGNLLLRRPIPRSKSPPPQ